MTIAWFGACQNGSRLKNRPAPDRESSLIRSARPATTARDPTCELLPEVYGHPASPPPFTLQPVWARTALNNGLNLARNGSARRLHLQFFSFCLSDFRLRWRYIKGNQAFSDRLRQREVGVGVWHFHPEARDGLQFFSSVRANSGGGTDVISFMTRRAMNSSRRSFFQELSGWKCVPAKDPHGK